MPPLRQTVLELVQGMACWLKLHDSNVVVIICNDALHRSGIAFHTSSMAIGLLVSSLLLYLECFDTIWDAYHFFHQRRSPHPTYMSKMHTGMPLPSFERSMLYFADTISKSIPIDRSKKIQLRQIIINTIPHCHPATFSPGIAIFQDDRLLYNSLMLDFDCLVDDKMVQCMTLSPEEGGDHCADHSIFSSLSRSSTRVVIPSGVNMLDNQDMSPVSSNHFSPTSSHNHNKPGVEDDRMCDDEFGGFVDISPKFGQFLLHQDTNHIIFNFPDPLPISGDIYFRLFHVPDKSIRDHRLLYKQTTTVASLYFHTTWIDTELNRFTLNDLEVSGSKFNPDFSVDLVFDDIEPAMLDTVTETGPFRSFEAEINALYLMIGVVPEPIFLESLVNQAFPKPVGKLDHFYEA